MAINEHVSASTQTQALCAIVFLYRYVLNKDIGLLEGLIRAKKPKRLPVVLTKQETKAVIGFLEGDKWLMGMLLYGAGLRLMECLRLRVQDIDFSRNEMMVHESSYTDCIRRGSETDYGGKMRWYKGLEQTAVGYSPV